VELLHRDCIRFVVAVQALDVAPLALEHLNQLVLNQLVLNQLVLNRLVALEQLNE